MKREVVQDFLNLPGIVGFALMDGRSRPYFCGVDQTLNFQQREALSQGIQQVIDTTPESFEFFEFQFSGNQVYLYKLDHGIILLVLTNSELVRSAYAATLKRLKVELQEDVAVIATFRVVAGTTTLSGQPYWKQQPSSQPVAKAPSPSPDSISGSLALDNPIIHASVENSFTGNSPNGTRNQTSAFSESSPPEISPSETSLAFQPEQHSTLGVPSSTFENAATENAAAENTATENTATDLNEILSAINRLSQFTTQYLGTTVVVNYWKTSRPAVDWLNNFQVERSAQMIFTEQKSINSSSTITAEQHRWVQAWVTAFIERCTKVIRDFPKIVSQKALNDRQKSLLLSNKS